MEKARKQAKQKTANEMIQIAREYAFLGMYQEAILKFQKGISMIKEAHLKGKSDAQLYEAYTKLIITLEQESSYCKTLNTLIREGQILEDNRMHEERRPVNQAHPIVRQNSEKSGPRLPYGTKPFSYHKKEGSNPPANQPYQNPHYGDKFGGGYGAPPPDPGNVQWIGQERNVGNDHKIGRDPDEWSPPPKDVKLKKKKSHAGNAGNAGNAGGKNRNYDKPWKVRQSSKEDKKKGKGAKDEDSPFLLSHYPDGTGPDAELIKMLERDMLDRNPNVSFDDIASLQDAKQVLKETVLLPLMMPDYFKGIRAPRKGVMLFGPPGTGKTMLAKAVATFGKTTFFNVHSSTLASKWKGDSEKLVRLLFEMARFYAPSTIFIDEIDSLAGKREEKDGEGSRKVKSELLTQIDGANSGDEEEGDTPKNIIVLGATNLPWDLDLAIIRRLDKRVYIPLPDAHAREELFKIMIKKENVDKNINWGEIVKKTHMFSGDDIKNLCRDAAMAPLRRLMLENLGADIESIKAKQDELKNQPITEADFLYALNYVRPSNTDEKLKDYQNWMLDYGSN